MKAATPASDAAEVLVANESLVSRAVKAVAPTEAAASMMCDGEFNIMKFVLSADIKQSERVVSASCNSVVC